MTQPAQAAVRVTVLPAPENGQECDACADAVTRGVLRITTPMVTLYVCDRHAWHVYAQLGAAMTVLAAAASPQEEGGWSL